MERRKSEYLVISDTKDQNGETHRRYRNEVRKASVLGKHVQYLSRLTTSVGQVFAGNLNLQNLSF